MGERRKVVSMIAFNGHRVLVVKKGDIWILPGGQSEGTESNIVCLRRELLEELPRLRVRGDFYFHGIYIGTSPHIGDEIEVHAYRAIVEGDITPNNEITESMWLAYSDSGFKLSEVLSKVMNSLNKDGLI